MSILISAHVTASPPTIFHYRLAESGYDSRYVYDTSLLELALQKTLEKYGPYELRPTPQMTFPRAKLTLTKNIYSNLFIKLSYEKGLNSSFAFVPFPVDLGIVGYRVCFVSKSNLDRVAAAKSFEELKQFTHGQGADWTDIAILRAQGIDVIEVPVYESLFKMVAINRFDLFCRGANELRSEYQTHKHIKGLDYDRSMSIAYPLPRFFYTHPDNKDAIKRIEEGLLAAYHDGSLERLWAKEYMDSIDFSQLKSRKIYWIDNPLLEGLDEGYKDYLYSPLQ